MSIEKKLYEKEIKRLNKVIEKQRIEIDRLQRENGSVARYIEEYRELLAEMKEMREKYAVMMEKFKRMEDTYAKELKGMK
jgi:uncharacterized coiled-coil protein SlyX